ncbi:MAG: hypothetical protein F6K09_21090, partial [Merismopedia sp. SIO2A8]|nr:hypothetical protein [Merismopedia sp. SIO2A8]
TVDVCAYVFQNDATTSGLIILDNNSGGVAGLFEVVDLNGTTILSSNTTSSGTVSLLPNEAAFTDKTDTDNSCFTESDQG